jgi:sugar lactone lactonase YvrE
LAQEPSTMRRQHWLWSKAHLVPETYTSEQSGYFSIIEGKNQRLYIGAAKYGDNAYLIEYDPGTQAMALAVDAEKEIGVDAKGFAAQAKIHTRNNVGESGKIYFGTKQGYTKEGEKLTDYLGGYPMVYDPQSGKTRVYPIPIAGQGIISVTPDESRNVAYVSTCSDERPIESSHFMILDLEKGTYRDLLDTQHMYAFIVVDAQGRAYHPILGGRIARYDPSQDRLELLEQTIAGLPPMAESFLAHPESHPINWDISPDRKTLYSVAMSGNQLYSYDLTKGGDKLEGRSLGKLVADAERTDCRAMCVAPDGTVWAGVNATFKDQGDFLHVVSFTPGSQAPVDHGPIAISNPEYATLEDADGKSKPYHHGVYKFADGTLLPRYVVMGICAALDGRVYVTTIYPFTVHEIRIPKVAGLTTAYFHNSHADVLLSRGMMTDSLDRKGVRLPWSLSSLYVDQITPNDSSRKRAAEFHVPIASTIDQALRADGTKLTADAVMLVAEHGDYPESDLGQILYPKRRLFGELVNSFDKGERIVPVFFDKHLSDNFDDAKWIYDQAKARNIPLMAGSSLPVLWRKPPVDVNRDCVLEEIVAVSYHRLDAYGFHALEMVQCLAERRKNGESGVNSVRCIEGSEVWNAADKGHFDRKLLNAALARMESRKFVDGKNEDGKSIEELCPDPVLFQIHYEDGLKASVLTLNPAVGEWGVAWREQQPERVESTLFWTQESRPFYHFDLLLRGIEKMFVTDKPTYPVERTLLTTGMLDALLRSRKQGGTQLETPWLDIDYQSEWNWSPPIEPPVTHPIDAGRDD